MQKYFPFLCLGLFSLFLPGGNTQAQSGNSSCKDSQSKKTVVDQFNLKTLHEPICVMKSKTLKKINEEKKISYAIDLDKLSNGTIQIASDLFTPVELNSIDYKKLDTEGFTNKGIILVSKVAYLMSKNAESYFTLDHQLNKKYLEGCLYRTVVKDEEEDAAELRKGGVIRLIKTIKAELGPLGNIEDKANLEAAVSIFNQQKNLWEGSFKNKNADGKNLLAQMEEIGKAEREKWGSPQEIILIELGKAEKALHGSKIINEFYDLGPNDPRTLVVIHQLISLNLSFAKYPTISNSIINILHSDKTANIITRKLKSMLKNKIINKMTFETGVTVDTQRNKERELFNSRF